MLVNLNWGVLLHLKKLRVAAFSDSTIILDFYVFPVIPLRLLINDSSLINELIFLTDELSAFMNEDCYQMNRNKSRPTSWVVCLRWL
jgi:hypothetical protein